MKPKHKNVNTPLVSDIEKLTNDILKCFPKFFDHFEGWQYGTGVDASKDFKRMFNKAKKINKAFFLKLRLTSEYLRRMGI